MTPPTEPCPGKQCTRCGETKPRTEFYKAGKPGGKLKSRCKACCDEMSRKWAKDNAERVRENRRRMTLFRTYGLMPHEYLLLLEQQGGVCAICRQGEPRQPGRTRALFWLAVDHCHKTGAVRGLLCQKCNSAIGLLNDDPELLLRANSYLKREGGSVGQGVGSGLERPVRR
ncbi:endonuclease VII domain-containing protein [[Actinomadura] parvosata]|uniref:endonuclease VII domain-containing protein n=1 Tax=[Actinomadura] parvosata TaxID=1955412 RepID=UPI00406CCB59